MRRWWRWTWRAWMAILLTMCVQFIFFLILGRTSSVIALIHTQFILSFALELCWAFVTARFLLAALRTDFPAIDSKRWTIIFVGGTCTTFAATAFDPVIEFVSDSAFPYYHLVVVLARGLIIAGALWWFALRSHAQGGTAWLAWNAGAIFILWLGRPVADMLADGLTREAAAVLSICAFIVSMVLAAPISGVGAALLSPRHGASDRGGNEA
jgi:hypothetical protein